MENNQLDLGKVVLVYGSHSRREDGVCFNEAVAWFAGRPHSDCPPCVSPAIRSFTMRLNDRWDDKRRQALVPFIPKVVGTNTNVADERRRACLATDWLLRVCTPIWLDMAQFPEEAAELRALPEVMDETTARAARKVAIRARDKAHGVREEAWVKLTEADAPDAATDSFANAYAYAAATAAAYAADSAVDALAYVYAYAVYAAAASNSVADAAYSADSAAGTCAIATAEAVYKGPTYAQHRQEIKGRILKELGPTIEKVDASALDLLNRMIAVGKTVEVIRSDAG
jgi:hypothetical protein